MGIARKFGKTLVALLLVLLLSVGVVSAQQTVVTILGTSDLHGHIFPWDYAVDEEDDDTGLAKVASVVKEVRAENPNTLLLDAGDTIQDNMASLFNDEPVHPMIQAMNLIGYDTWTVGNHEFNFGLDVLGRAIDGSKATVLAANIYKEDGSRWLTPYVIKEVAGIKIGIFGLVTPHITRWEASTPSHFAGLVFADPIEEAKKVVAELKGKVDAIVAVAHMGMEPEYGVPGSGLRAVLAANPEIDVVLAGHAHADIPGEEVNGVLVVEPKRYGNRVSRIDLTFEQKDGRWELVKRESTNINTKGYEPDSEVVAAFQKYHDEARAEVNTVIGKVTADFLPEPYVLPGIPTAQVQDTALVDFINKVQLKYTGADISAAALFSTRSDLNPGDFRKKDVANIYKYDNTLIAVKVTGKQLKDYMEWSAAYYNTAKPGDVTVSFNPNIRGYNYDMFAGVEYEIDISQPPGNRIKNLTFKGKPVTDDQEFVLAVNNYRFGNMVSDGYFNEEDKVFDSYEKWGDAGRIRDLIIKYVEEQGEVTPECDYNWRIVGADLDHPLKDEVYELVESGKLEIPTSADGRTPNVKSLNVYELIQEGVLPYKTLTILHTNDTHSRLLEGKYDGMGMAKIATLVDRYRQVLPASLVLDAGDAFHGQTIATLVKGESVAKVFNAVGYDAMTAGNHDFNYGYQRLLELDRLADFPILAANVLDADGNPIFAPYMIKGVGGIYVGIFGLATPETTYKTHPKNVEGLTFADPIETARKMVKELKDKVDVIVALTHLGLDKSSEVTSEDLAWQVTGIDVIVDGHSHSELTEGLMVNNTLIVQAGEYDKNLGVAELLLKDGRVVQKYAKLISKAEAASVPEDQEVLDVLAQVKAENEKITSVVIGKTAVTLDGERAHVRTRETNLGNLICDAMLAATGADAALTNGGGIRASIEPGEITKGEVITVLPFGNIVVVKKMTGAQLLAAVEYGLSAYPDAAGSFCQIGGMTVNFDPSAPAGSRVTRILVQGEPLDPERYYTVATNDFLAAGGDGYTMFAEAETVAELGGLDEVLINYIQEQGTVAPKVDGRLSDQPAADFVEYIIELGDTLSEIAEEYGVSIGELVELNAITNPDLIYAGQSLNIPVQ
ncbi:MAG: 5'-nucleotidase C-terminal domain-containing protein [Firmicutes bacterium]|nr:5'-nucleotidase C-terminal domain-containing protein [Bacillota bacterium]